MDKFTDADFAFLEFHDGTVLQRGRLVQGGILVIGQTLVLLVELALQLADFVGQLILVVKGFPLGRLQADACLFGAAVLGEEENGERHVHHPRVQARERSNFLAHVPQ